MTREGVKELLDRIGVIRHRRDLDVLLFFARHSHALLTNEHIAAFVGYDLQQVTATLDTTMGAGLLHRAQHQSSRRNMYVFRPQQALEKPLASLLQIASSRPGRLAILQALESWAPGASGKA